MTTLRHGTFLICKKEYFAGTDLIKLKDSAKVLSVDKTHCMLKIKDKIFSMLIEETIKNWEIDVKTELYYRGMSREYLNKIDSLGSLSEIKRQYLIIRKSGINDHIMLVMMRKCIDSELMEKAIG